MTSACKLFIAGTFMLVLLLSGCATPIKHAYAYDDHTVPEQNVGVILGYYGVPGLLVNDVDGKKFGITFSQPHPVKIYVLPGERKVTAIYFPAYSTQKPPEDTLIIKVEPGHTYKLESFFMPTENKVKIYAIDQGLNYKSPY